MAGFRKDQCALGSLRPPRPSPGFGGTWASDPVISSSLVTPRHPACPKWTWPHSHERLGSGNHCRRLRGFQTRLHVSELGHSMDAEQIMFLSKHFPSPVCPATIVRGNRTLHLLRWSPLVPSMPGWLSEYRGRWQVEQRTGTSNWAAPGAPPPVSSHQSPSQDEGCPHRLSTVEAVWISGVK